MGYLLRERAVLDVDSNKKLVVFFGKINSSTRLASLNISYLCICF